MKEDAKDAGNHVFIKNASMANSSIGAESVEARPSVFMAGRSISAGNVEARLSAPMESGRIFAWNAVAHPSVSTTD